MDSLLNTTQPILWETTYDIIFKATSTKKDITVHTFATIGNTSIISIINPQSVRRPICSDFQVSQVVAPGKSYIISFFCFYQGFFQTTYRTV